MAKKKLTIEIDDTIFAEVLDAFSATHGYRDIVPNPEAGASPQTPQVIPNPVSKEDFLLDKIAEFVGDSARAGVIDTAVAAEKVRAKADADARIKIEKVKGA